MTTTIAMAGKGGTGKTTVSALLIKYLIEHAMTPVLAVDADANANLNEVLGLDVRQTIGEIRSEIKTDMPPGMSRDQFMEMKIHQALIEESGFDLMVMGQPDGPGCYCAANQYLAMTMDRLAENYRYIVVDNEAGMEHLSRRTSGHVDWLYLVTDYSLRGLRAVGRINSMLDSLKLSVDNLGIIVTRAPQQLNETFRQEVEVIGLPIAGIIPDDPALLDFDMEKRSLMELPDNSPAVLAVDEILTATCPA